MITFKLLQPEGILVLTPEAPLESSDFERIAHEIDPYLKEHRQLSGVLIHAKAFPGWANLEALMAHVKFIESHHQKVKRLALVTDSGLLKELPRFVGHFVHPEVKHFPESQFDDAFQWLKGAPK